MPYDIEKDEGGELEITPPYVQYPLSTKGKEPETRTEGFNKCWSMSREPEYDYTPIDTENFEPISGWQSYPPDSQVQINNIVDEVEGDIYLVDRSDTVDRVIVNAIADEIKLTMISMKLGSWPFRTNALQKFYDKVVDLLKMNGRL